MFFTNVMMKRFREQLEKSPLAESSRQTITGLLSNAEDDPALAEQLLPLVYEELRRLAGSLMSGEKPGQTLQPTALVHEAYTRLVADPELQWDSRAHFFAAAARSMRQILINRAKKRKAEKHGGGRGRQELDDAACRGGAEARTHAGPRCGVDEAREDRSSKRKDCQSSLFWWTQHRGNREGARPVDCDSEARLAVCACVVAS